MGGESQRVSVFSESWDQIRGWSNCASIITPRIQPTLYHHTREQRAPVCLSHRISMEFWIILLIIFHNRPMISKSFLVYIIIGYLLEFSSTNCLMYTLIGWLVVCTHCFWSPSTMFLVACKVKVIRTGRGPQGSKCVAQWMNAHQISWLSRL